MAKQPEIETITATSDMRSKLNKNFKAIADKFEEALSRTGTDTPNHMLVDLDVSDANITNTNVLNVNSFFVNTSGFENFDGLYVYKLDSLDCAAGAIVTHNSVGDPVCLEAGTDGQVLKLSGGYPTWAADNDEDTIGVTVQEDGVTVAENVTNINFLWTLGSGTIVTTPAINQADLDLEELLVPPFEDTNDNDTNINPTNANIWTDVSQITRIDLFTDAGIAAAEVGGIGANEYSGVAEASCYLTDSVGAPPAQGTWELAMRAYDDTGTSTPLTGTLLGEEDILGTSDGGNLLTIFWTLPEGTRYVDTAWTQIVTFPIFLQTINFSDRYRAIIRQSRRGLHQTPQGYTDDAINPQITV